MIMADKHFLGIPLLEGSMWRSPRIPPNLTIMPNRGEAKSSRSKSDRHSAPASPNSSRGDEEAFLFKPVRPLNPPSSSPLQSGFSDITTQLRQLNQGSHFISNSPSLCASTTTALSIHTPLETHDPLFDWIPCHESDHFCAVIILVVAMLILVMISICRSLWASQASQASSHRNTKDVGTQFPDLPPQQHLNLEIPMYWEYIPNAAVPLGSMTSQDNSTKAKTATRCSHCEKILIDVQEESSVPNKKDDDSRADVPVIEGEVEECGQGGDQLASELEEKESKEERKEDRIQDGETEDAGTDMNVLGRKEEEDRGQNRDQLRSDTGAGEGKEEWEERCNVDKEDGGDETANNSGEDGLNGSQVVGGEPKKMKKRRVRASAKQRAKRAAAAESRNTTGEASNDLLPDQKQCGHEEGKPKPLGSEVAEPGARDVLAMSQGKGKGKDKAPVEDSETVGKGSYSLKQTDLHEATFVATDTGKKQPLPPRPPTPQPKEKCAPLGLPPRPQFTKLPITKNNGTPPSAPATTAKPTLSSSLWASNGKEPAQPKRDVPPLLPHHQSFGAAQRKPIFSNLSSQFMPIAGTNPSSSSRFGGNNGVNGSSFFGTPPPNGPMYRFGGDEGGAGR